MRQKGETLLIICNAEKTVTVSSAFNDILNIPEKVEKFLFTKHDCHDKIIDVAFEPQAWCCVLRRYAQSAAMKASLHNSAAAFDVPFVSFAFFPKYRPALFARPHLGRPASDSKSVAYRPASSVQCCRIESEWAATPILKEEKHYGQGSEGSNHADLCSS